MNSMGYGRDYCGGCDAIRYRLSHERELVVTSHTCNVADYLWRRLSRPGKHARGRCQRCEGVAIFGLQVLGNTLSLLGIDNAFSLGKSRLSGRWVDDV
jgi:hypothetical protein